MASNYNIHLPERIANKYNKLYWLTIKLHKVSSSIGFIKKCLHLHITPTFAKVNGQFLHNEDKHDAERHIMISHVKRHILDLKEVSKNHISSMNDLRLQVGKLLFHKLYRNIIESSRNYT